MQLKKRFLNKETTTTTTTAISQQSLSFPGRTHKAYLLWHKYQVMLKFCVFNGTFK
jgi:hypothetical protein